MLRIIYSALLLCLRATAWGVRSRSAQTIQIAVLRHELEILRRSVRRPRMNRTDRVVLSAASRLLDRSRWAIFLVRPDTLLRWHRELVSARARRWGARARGRPPISGDLRRLIVRLGRENPTWGYNRIAGELKKLGYRVSPTTVRNLLRRNGLGPAPRRSGPSWSQFLKANAKAVIACDFLTVITAWGTTLYLLFFIELGSRKVHLGGATRNPTSEWARERALDVIPKLTRRAGVLIHDRDTKFAGDFDSAFLDGGIAVRRTPIRAPKANAVAERWIRTLREECLDHQLIFGRGHLDRVVREYVGHYNHARPHRSLDLSPPVPPGPLICRGSSLNEVRRRDVLGGLIHEYYRAA